MVMSCDRDINQWYIITSLLVYVSMCAGLPSRLDLYHDLARVQERVLHLEQENAALRAACASAAAGRSADALECGDGHGEDESLAQEDYGEGTARMEEVPMDEGWMHLKRAVDRDRAFVDFRRFRSSVNAVTINPSDNAFAQYNADLDRGLHNAAQATLRRPGRKILPTSCNAHSKFHLDKHVSLIRGHVNARAQETGRPLEDRGCRGPRQTPESVCGAQFRSTCGRAVCDQMEGQGRTGFRR